MLIDPEHPDEVAVARALDDRLIRRALAMAGTGSGEHGIGLGKIGCMEAEHGDALTAMRAVKQALDPLNLMNPGKILPS